MTTKDTQEALTVAYRAASDVFKVSEDVVPSSREYPASFARHIAWLALTKQGWPPSELARATGKHRSTILKALQTYNSFDGDAPADRQIQDLTQKVLSRM